MILRSLAAAVFLAVASSANAQTVITAVPYTISTSGKYVLGTNVITASAGQSAITILAPNVILDLNGFFLSGPGNTPGSFEAVIRVTNVSNVTIRNGTLANYGYGIFFTSGTDSINHTVEHLNITRCYLAGIFLGSASAGSSVRHNTISQIGGSTLTGTGETFGILANGGVRIEGNSIATVTPTGNAQSFGITTHADDFMIGNTISNCTVGISGGKYLNNLTSGCTTPFQGGVNAVGNN